MKNTEYEHLFHRDKDPFERIINKTKKFEIRLNDEKRQKVRIGDRVKGVLRDDENKFFISEITGLSHFENWENLFYAFGDRISESDKGILERVYNGEKLGRYGILIMHFKLLNVYIK